MFGEVTETMSISCFKTCRLGLIRSVYNGKDLIECVCICPTHFGEQLGHLLWISLLAGGEDSQQTFQAQVGEAAALLFLPCVLHHAGDVGVTPHQHAVVKQRPRGKCAVSREGSHASVCKCM